MIFEDELHFFSPGSFSTRDLLEQTILSAKQLIQVACKILGKLTGKDVFEVSVTTVVNNLLCKF